jgi:hypothetical protein
MRHLDSTRAALVMNSTADIRQEERKPPTSPSTNYQLAYPCNKAPAKGYGFPFAEVHGRLTRPQT